MAKDTKCSGCFPNYNERVFMEQCYKFHMHILKRQFRDIPLLKFRKQNNKNQLTTNLPLG